MNILDFIGQVVISKSTGKRYTLSEITSPYIDVKDAKPNSAGYYSSYC